ncbi:hypothetical protein [Clostridium cylindrosporum]|uniref:Uncharacterized protein n=1 Tax=Clostridium cylindrosporum DSM 605 TaxID=1121307 RepID=A0A0J8DAS4_CLOCY|nr:hypothetical protein [Clostridium cylindrosporum]KMT22952.1 hypothetical protein CLCY_5c01910 [Clostridium cylindrosporum DSM 605]
MGALYREEVQCYDKRVLKIAIGIMAIILAVLILCFISDIMLFGDYYKVVLGVTALISITSTIKFRRKMDRVYRYQIIDNEILIEDVTKGRRIVKINFKAKNIVTIDKLGVKYSGKERIVREYDFTCNSKCMNVKRCIFEREGKLYSLKFEPSEALIRKIDGLRGIVK